MWVTRFGVAPFIYLRNGQLEGTWIREEEAIIMLLHPEHTSHHIISMNHQVGQSFADGSVHRGVVFSLGSLEDKGAPDVLR